MTDTTNPYRTHNCGELRSDDVGETVRLSGWVHAVRDFGGVIFIDLRDRYGLTQLTFRESVAEAAAALRAETVVTVEGEVITREKPNPERPTGQIEVVVETLEVHNKPKQLPIEVNYLDKDRPNEELRFRHRHLDLRRREQLELLELRSAIVKSIHAYLHEQGFIEVETPILNRATPEGARDFLVPSRVHPGEFYALPQSPQLMKQILMVAGVDRYYQIARCFRDEALRKDRQLEFTQLDLEMSFVTPEDVYAVIEGMFVRIFRDVLGVELSTPLRRMPYREAVDTYGIDRPDVRFGMPLVDITEMTRGCEFGVFANAEQVKGICVKGGASYSRKVLDKELTPEAKEMGAGGMPWMKAADGALAGGVSKFFAEQHAALREAFGAEDGDLLLFAADRPKVVADALGRLRSYIAEKEGLVSHTQLEPLWVVDFPMFEPDEETGQVTYVHHPFTMPTETDPATIEAEPLSLGSHGYDLVMNGFELGGGSIRIHRRDVQESVFRVLGIEAEEAAERFGWFMDTLDHGAPPHGGIALGIDRIAMLLAQARYDREVPSIREVIVFPKTMRATCPLTRCPSPVDAAALDELHVSVKEAKDD